MSTTVELSIIVPVFNAMPLLRDCLFSIFEQDIAPSRYEVIFVDDGSTDGSAEYLDKQAGHYANMHVVHQKNSGSPSAPRNAGIDLASGDYVFFCDADDVFFPNVFRDMLRHAERKRFDVGVFKIERQGIGGDYRGLFSCSRDDVAADDYQLLSFFGPYKLIRRDMLSRLKIRFIDGISKEDQPFSLECYLNASRISVIADKKYYCYRFRDDGVSASQGGLSTAFDSSAYRRAGVLAYLDTVGKYASAPERPMLYYRVFETIVSDLRSFLKAPDFARMAAWYREVARQHYCDEVRGCMAFNTLIALDALFLGGDDDHLRDALSFATLPCPIVFCQINDTVKYWLRSFGNDPSMPDMRLPPGSLQSERLRRPAFKRNYISECYLDGGTMRIEGATDCFVSDADTHIEPFVRLKLVGQDLYFDAPCEVNSCRYEPAFALAKHLFVSWRSSVDLHALSPGVSSGQFDLYLGIPSPDKELILTRLGGVCAPAVPETFSSASFRCEDVRYVPYITARGNLSLRIVQNDLPIDAACECGLTDLHWVGTRLYLDGTLWAPTSSKAASIKLAASLEGSGASGCETFPAEYTFDSRKGRFFWNSEVDASALVGKTPEGSHWTFSLVLSDAGKKGVLPLGKVRPKGTLRKHQSAIAKVSGRWLVPSRTDSDYLSIGFLAPGGTLFDCLMVLSVTAEERLGLYLDVKGSLFFPGDCDDAILELEHSGWRKKSRIETNALLAYDKRGDVQRWKFMGSFSLEQLEEKVSMERSLPSFDLLRSRRRPAFDVFLRLSTAEGMRRYRIGQLLGGRGSWAVAQSFSAGK